MKALILLSGGQDSATCLALATREYSEVHSVAFDYGQRHRRELNCSKILSELAGVKSHTTLVIDTLKQLGGTALIDRGTPVDGSHGIDKDLPATFVPGRNLIFLTLAAAKAYQLGIDNLVTGVCQTDYAGYPDCRNNSIKAIQVTISLCFGKDVNIYTPLMWKTKAETINIMQSLDKVNWYKYTHTCYEGQDPPCGRCPACTIRAEGFRTAGIDDPLLLKKEVI